MPRGRFSGFCAPVPPRKCRTSPHHTPFRSVGMLHGHVRPVATVPVWVGISLHLLVREAYKEKGVQVTGKKPDTWISASAPVHVRAAWTTL